MSEIHQVTAPKESVLKELKNRLISVAGPTNVVVNTREIEYVTRGVGRPATVFIHGVGGQKEAWMITQRAVASLGQTTAVDLPGHGGSAKSVETGDLDELASYVIGVMDELKIGRAHIVGHSLGAVIAAHIAKTHPDRASSVFLIAAAGAGTIVNPQFLEKFGKAESHSEVENAMGPLFVDEKMISKEMVQAVLKIKRIEGVNECLDMISAASGTELAALNPADTLAEISVPISMVWGAQDQVCALSNADGLPSTVNLTVFEDAGHMVQIEKMEEVNKLILQHIEASI